MFYLTFVLTTFLFAGACLFLLINFDKSFNVNNYSTYSLPLGVITIIVFFITIVIKNIFINVYKRKTLNSYIYKIKVCNENKSDELLGYLDSGNFLQDNITNKPITVVDFNCLKSVLSNVSLPDIILLKTEKLNKSFKNVHFQMVSSVNNGTKLLVFEVDRLEVYLDNKINVINNACIGLSIKSFANSLGYNALLNPQLI